MAEKTKAKAAKAAKPKKAAPAKKAAVTPKPKRRTAKPKARPQRAAASPSGFDITRLIDHPLVADLLTVGALAAVGAIAEHNVKTRTGEAEAGSSKVVKAAGKAAASAIGKRLMTEVGAVRTASKKAT